MLEQATALGTPVGSDPVRPLAPRSVFETPDYRAVYDVDRVVEIDPGDGVALVFHDCGDHAVCLARTAPLDAGLMERASRALFDDVRFRFVVFEDVHLAPSFAVPAGVLRLRYQNDWILPIDGPEPGLRHSFLRKMDKKLRRMARDFGDISLELEHAPSRQLVEATIDLNRKRIEATGQSYRMDDAKRERLAKALSRIGVAAVLRHGDRLVAADLFVQCGRDAYAILGGYDPAYHRDSPGLQTMRHAVEYFEARDFGTVHLMWGDGGYKEWLGARRMPLSTLIVPRSAGEWLSPAILRVAARYGVLDLKRRAKEWGLSGETVKKIGEWPKRLQLALRPGG